MASGPANHLVVVVYSVRVCWQRYLTKNPSSTNLAMLCAPTRSGQSILMTA